MFSLSSQTNFYGIFYITIQGNLNEYVLEVQFRFSEKKWTLLCHLLYSKPTHALLLSTLSHLHFKTLKLLKNFFVKTLLKPYMFRSLLYDHSQGSSFVLLHYHLSACLLRPDAYSVCGCMWSMCVCARWTCLWVVWSCTKYERRPLWMVMQ
jgi:hypothetical protein